jgi:hypothetical protein
VVAKRYQNIQAAGNIAATGIEYASKDVPKPVSVSNLLLNFYTTICRCNTMQSCHRQAVILISKEN